MCSAWSRSASILSRSKAAPKPVLRVPRRPGLPPRHRRRGGGPPVQPRTHHRARRPVQPGLHPGFLERRPANDYQNYETGSSESQRSQFVGEVKSVQDGWAEVETKNRFGVGDHWKSSTPAATAPCSSRRCAAWTAKRCRSPRAPAARAHPHRRGPAEGADCAAGVMAALQAIEI